MKIFSKLYLFILFNILCTSFVFSQTKWTVNNHYYQVASIATPNANTTNVMDAIAKNFKSSTPAGYVATWGNINTVEEFNFLRKNVYTTTDNLFVGVVRVSDSSNRNDRWLFFSGPEAGTLYYNAFGDVTSGWGNWKIGQPEANTNEYTVCYVPDDNAYHSWGLSTSTSTLYKFLIEYVPLNEPWADSVNQEGGLTIVNLNNYFSNLDLVRFYITPSGSTSPISIPIISISSLNATIDMPPGQGINNFTVTDGVKSYTNTLYKYISPNAQVIYPPATGNVVTVTGANFGNNSNDLLIKVGANGDICSQPTIIVPKSVFTCSLPYTPTSTKPLLPMNITVGTQSFSTIKIGIYDYSTSRVTRIFLSQGSVYQYFLMFAYAQYYIDGYKAFFGNLNSANHLSLLKNMIPFGTPISRVNVGIVNKMFENKGGPYDTTVAVDSKNICDLSKLLWCPGGTMSPTSQYVYFDFAGSGIYAFDNGQSVTSGGFFQYGDYPPTTNDAIPKHMSTSGGSFTLVMTGAGFKYSKRTLLINNVAITGATFVFINRTQIIINVPSGTGGPKPSKLNMDSFSLNIPSIGYLPPTLSSIDKQPSTNGDIIVLSGINFGNNQSAISVTIGGVFCSSVTIINAHTSISCQVPSGVGKDLETFVIVDNQKSNPFPLSYATPQIINIYQEGSTLIISGTNFGTSKSSIKVNTPTSIQPTLDPTPGTIQNVSITLPVDSQNGEYSVTVGGIPSPGFQWNLIPSIISISPSTVKTTGDDLVVLTGSFLQTTRQDNSDADVKILLGGNECTGAYSESDQTYSYLTCTTPKGTGKNLKVQVIIDSQSSNELNTFSYNSPIITNFIQKDDVVTIAGSDFGEDFSVISLSYNSKPAINATGMHLTRDSAIVPIPDDTLNGNVVINVNGQSSPSFSFNLYPFIVSGNQIPTVGGKMILTGKYFNPTSFNGTNLPMTVSFHDIPCEHPNITISNTEITCDAPEGSGTNRTVTVTIDGYHDTFPISYIPPYIQNISSTGESIFISGTNFGPDQSVVKITFTISTGTVEVNSTSLSSGTNQTVETNGIPLNALNGPLFISVDGQLSNEAMYTLVPTIFNVTQAPTAGGIVTIGGKHFTAIRGDGFDTLPVITIGDQLCSDPLVEEFDTIVCKAPVGTGISNDLYVSIDNSTSNRFSLAYLPPNITSWEQNGISITINGHNIGSSSEVSQISMGVYSSFATSTNDISIIAPIPLFAESGPIVVNIDSQISNTLDVLLTPYITSISSTGTLGGPISIQGYFLNGQRQNKTSTTVLVNFNFQDGSKKECTDTSFSKDTQYTIINCKAPEGSGNNIPVTVTIDGMTSTFNFSYGAPQLIDISISNTNEVTLNGTNFGNDKSLVNVTLNDIPIVDFELKSSNIITFQAPKTSINGLVLVSVDGIETNGKSASFFPILESSTQPTTQGSAITIFGSFLNHYSFGNRQTNVAVLIDNVNCSSINWIPNNNSAVICTPNPGTGTQHKIQVSIELFRSNFIEFSYQPPTISSISQSQDSIVISGTNFGTDPSKVSISTGYTISTISHTEIHAILSTGAKNSILSVNVDTQSSNQYNFNIQPIITSVGSASPYGGFVTIGGRYLNTKRDNNSNSDIVITVNQNSTCQLETSPSDGSGLICSLSGKVSFNRVTINVTIDNKSSTSLYSSLSPVVSSATPLFYQVGGYITVSGEYFMEPSSILIGGVESCDSVTIRSSNSLICHYNSTVQPSLSSNSNISIQVTSVTLQGSGNVFNYLQDTCESGCNEDNGVCINGFCQCKTGFSGSNCNIPYDNQVIPTVNQYGGQFISNISFSALIAGIKELDGINVVHTWSFNDSSLIWSTLNTTDNVDSMTTVNQGIFGNNQFKVVIETTTWKKDSIFSFVGQQIVSPTNSFTHRVTISNYTFTNPSNSSLQVLYRMTFPTSYYDKCEKKQNSLVSQQNSLTDTLKSITVDTPYGVMVGTFSNRIIVDEVHKLLDIQKSTDNTTFPYTSDGTSVEYISLNIPQFNDHVIFDPTFVSYSKSLVVQNECGGNSKKSRNWVVPVAVVCSIVGAALLATGAYLIYKHKSQTNHMQRMVEMDLD